MHSSAPWVSYTGTEIIENIWQPRSVKAHYKKKKEKFKKIISVCPQRDKKDFLLLSVSHDFICYSPYCHPYNSYVVSLENFVWDQLAIHQWSAWYCAAVVGRNILSWSLKAVKWLKLCKTLTVRGFVTSVPQPTSSLSNCIIQTLLKEDGSHR